MKYIKTFEDFTGRLNKTPDTNEVEQESESVIESGGYIEAMDPDLDTAVMDIRRIFLEWKDGPATERGISNLHVRNY